MIEVRVDGLDELDRFLSALPLKINTTAILDEAAAILLNRIRTRFRNEQGPDGPWEPSDAGLKRKAGGYTYRLGKRYTATGTLFETGTLFHSIQLAKYGDDGRVLSSDVPYGHYHQRGTGKLPKREFLAWNDDDMSVASLLVVKRVKEALSG